MAARRSQNGTWQNWLSFWLGLGFAISPWIAGYSNHDTPTGNAAVVGMALALASHYEVSFDTVSAEWLNLVTGLWLVAAPFVLGFDLTSIATLICAIAGFAVAVLAWSAMFLPRGGHLLRH